MDSDTRPPGALSRSVMKSSCMGATAIGPNRRCAPCRALERRSKAIWPAWNRRANWLLAPYLLTALIGSPQRLIYLTSGLHQGGDPDLRALQSRQLRWNGSQAY